MKDLIGFLIGFLFGSWVFWLAGVVVKALCLRFRREP